MYNARSEELATTFSRLLSKGNHCVVALDGYYEWPETSDKQPYYVSRSNGEPLLCAGLYADVETGADLSSNLRTHALLTTAACSAIGQLPHTRMLVLLSDWSAAASWLASAATTPSTALSSLAAFGLHLFTTS